MLFVIAYSNSNRKPWNSVGREFLEPDGQHLTNIVLSVCKEFSALLMGALGPTTEQLPILRFKFPDNESCLTPLPLSSPLSYAIDRGRALPPRSQRP